jgi:hypothetical protein
MSAGGDKLSKIDEQIAALRRERADLLSNPNRQEIRDLYGELERVLDRLDELGEDVSNGDGYTIHVTGTLFSYTHGDGLRER